MDEPNDSVTTTEAESPRLATLVVGVDLSSESLYALDLAAEIGAGHRAEIRVVHVHPQLSALAFSPMAAGEYEKAQAEIMDALEAEAATRLRSYAGTWSTTSRRGHVGHEILAEADEVDADLVIVGHRSHGTLHDALLGSVATGTVHHSRRSILVAIPPRREA